MRVVFLGTYLAYRGANRAFVHLNKRRKAKNRELVSFIFYKISFGKVFACGQMSIGTIGRGENTARAGGNIWFRFLTVTNR